MKSTMITGLVVLNVILLVLLAARFIKPNAANAQMGDRPSDYLMIPADFPGAPAGAVVVLDSVTGDLSAIMTDDNTKRMEGMPIIRMAEIFDKASGATPKKTTR